MNDLKDEKIVLFSGTPCEIDGLKKFLKFSKVSDKNLYTCDLICHGIPSPQLWRDNIDLNEKKLKSKLSKVEFRDKSFGWTPHYESYWFENREKKVTKKDYTNLFYQHIMFRPSCYICQYSSLERVGDITLGDFWGIEKNDASFNDEKGVSLLLINTQKGKELFDNCKNNFEYIQCEIENCMQPNLQKPSTVSSKRDDFWHDYYQFGFEYALKKYTKPKNFKELIKKVLWISGIIKHP